MFSQLLKSFAIGHPVPISTVSASPCLARAASVRLASNTVDHDFELKRKSLTDGTIDRQSNENTLSGTNDAVASLHAVSFDGAQSTDPAHARELAGDGNQTNPLDVSGANQEVSAVAQEVRNAIEETKTLTYAGKTYGKTKQTLAPGRKIFAGRDKRKLDSPREVADKLRIAKPGSR